ncbi:MAG TPA: UDP-N-acetylmuramoyl-tripeptide--D-alanyl-D-alanine ligase [Dissulfurispiraceae bacterium]|nr:UDP-N-acetylmuramoyl-tripeptide--D-alanyl-D-alanine ligase [Dissulfurispiraceae bacterium]
MLGARQILEATGGAIITDDTAVPLTAAQFSEDIFFTGLSIDSRTIREGELFLALKGDRFDGHDFVQDALKTGAGAIISHGRPVRHAAGKSTILVDDTLSALHAIAHFIRKKFGGSVIGVVGSNGKTTTKELIASVLGVKLNVLKTSGNFNNHIGLPLSITKVQENTDVMVLEMGANKPGDIKDLCAIGLPETGVITNLGQEHLEGFGSMAVVRDSELELLSCVTKLIINADDTFLMEGIEDRIKHRSMTFGIEAAGADVKAEGIELTDSSTRFALCTGSGTIVIDSRLSGRFNIYNSLAAAATAYAMGFKLEDIKKGLEAFNGLPMRSEVLVRGDITYINDAYNANPSSMEEAVRELVRRAKGGPERKRAIAVLGDMLELGTYSTDAHIKLGRWLSVLPVDILIGVGPQMSLAVEAFQKKGIAAGNAKAAAGELEKLVREGDVVLIKGSRGMKMEDALAFAVPGKTPETSGTQK